MDNIAFMTLPQAPVINGTYGKYISPKICEMLREIYGGNFYHCINLLDSFNDRDIRLVQYLENLEKVGVKYDNLWIDKDNMSNLLVNVYLLYEKGFIEEIETDVYHCSCGIIDIEESKIATCNPDISNFQILDGKLYCKHCHKECVKVRDRILVFNPHGVCRKDIHFIPDFLNKDTKTYEDIVLNSHVAISRRRDTKIPLIINNTCYNLDVDFLWQTYLVNFPEKIKVVVSGNKMLYQLFMVSLIEKCLNPDAQTILIGNPIIKNINDYLSYNNDSNIAYLSTLFNLRWKTKENCFDERLLTFVQKMSCYKRERILDSVLEGRVCDNLLFDIEDTLKTRCDMQKVLKRMKGSK